METVELRELTQQELIEIEAGFGPLYYAIAGIWSLGVSYGYLTNI